MANEKLVLDVKRLRDELTELRAELRARYKEAGRQVTSEKVKSRCTAIAETWLANISQRDPILTSVASEYLADLNVHFQRLLSYAEHASTRGRYEKEIKAILEKYGTDLVIPLMQGMTQTQQKTDQQAAGPGQGKQITLESEFHPTAFLGHSFSDEDLDVVKAITEALTAIGISVESGKKPSADRISEKVKALIEAQYLFVGLFTRGEKIAGRESWTTSEWVIDEKAYAFGRGKKLILLKEEGVKSIGGIQGDYEYIAFFRDKLQDAIIQLLKLFRISASGTH